MNVSAHMTLFEQEMMRRQMSVYTIKTYLTNATIFFNQSQSDHPKNVYEHEVRDFLTKFDEPNTQRSYHSAIKKFFEICLHQPNKFRYIPYAKQSKKLPIVLAVDEIQKMFNVCENLKHKVILALLYATGIRSSELINLQWSNLDRIRGIINIIGAKGKKDRQVPLPGVVIGLLQDYWWSFQMDQKPRPYILGGQTIKGVIHPQYSKSSVLAVVKQLAVKAEIKKEVWTHLIRHCTGTHLFESGVELRLIQQVFGHESQKTTNLYCHTSSNHIAKINSPINAIDLGLPKVQPARHLMLKPQLLPTVAA